MDKGICGRIHVFGKEIPVNCEGEFSCLSRRDKVDELPRRYLPQLIQDCLHLLATVYPVLFREPSAYFQVSRLEDPMSGCRVRHDYEFMEEI